MSTPIKPPGSPPAAGPGSADEAGAERVEGRSGEFRDRVEEASEPATDAAEAPAEAASGRLSELRREVVAGRIGPDEAIDRLVRDALGAASGLPEAHRAALEAQLRRALAEDPTLVALRRDLERAAKT